MIIGGNYEERVMCNTFANSHSFIDYEHLELVADEAMKKFQETGELKYKSISDQLKEILESDIDAADDGIEYAPSDFSALTKRFIDFCMGPESDIAGHFHDVYEDEGQGGTDDIEVYSVISPLNSEFAYRPKHFKDGQEGQAVEFWFKMSKKYRTCTALFGLRYQGQAIHDWVTQPEDEVRD